MKPDFFSPMTMGKTAWRIASDDLSPAFPRRSFSAPKNRSGNIAGHYTGFCHCAGTQISRLYHAFRSPFPSP